MQLSAALAPPDAHMACYCRSVEALFIGAGILSLGLLTRYGARCQVEPEPQGARLNWP